MTTKLVYVLTCAPEATYIEQAMMSVWSARYWNPEAHIVLIVDDRTNQLLVGEREEILNYISEKIVIPFEDASLSPMYRSRWIKTQVCQYVSGNFLYIDCDTICCKSLDEIDKFECEIGAVPDNNTLFQYDVYKEETSNLVLPIGCDISQEQYYFSSGVIYCQDTIQTHKLFSLWHKYWLNGVEQNINIDQPSLAKANIEMGHFITPIDDEYNYVLYTESPELSNSTILHITSKPKISFLFQSRVMSIIRKRGMTPWGQELVLNVHKTYLPFDYLLKYSSLKQRCKWVSGIAFAARIYGEYVDKKYEEWQFRVAIAPYIKRLFANHMYKAGAFFWLLWRRSVVRKANFLRPNVCSAKLLPKL